MKPFRKMTYVEKEKAFQAGLYYFDHPQSEDKLPPVEEWTTREWIEWIDQCDGWYIQAYEFNGIPVYQRLAYFG